MTRPPIRRSGPPPERTYKPRPIPAEPEPRKPRLYNLTAWRGGVGHAGARALKLRKNPLCERCLLHGKHTPTEHIHHRIDVADAPELAFDLANLESLCASCHNRESARRQRTKAHGAQPPRR